MFDDSMMGDIVPDRASHLQPEKSVEGGAWFDSGFQSGSLLDRYSPAHKSPAHRSPAHRSPAKAYNRLDSGICDHFQESLFISEPPKVESSTHSRIPEYSPNPHSKVLEYFDGDEDGDCQLHLAVAEGVTEVVYALIRLAPHPAYLDIQNNELYAPLHIAVLVNKPAMVRRLVVAGATTNIRDKEGNTPLHLAAKRGYKECAVALLRPVSTDELREAAISVGSPSTQLHSVLNLKNYNGEHCVHLATFGQHYDFLWFLFLKEADMDALEGRSGKSALHYAVNMADQRLVGLLATPKEQGGCGVLVNQRDWAGRTPYQCAKINRDEHICSALANIPGCDTSREDSDEDFEFDTDEDICDYDRDVEVNGMRILESTA